VTPAGTHTCPSWVTLTLFITSDKWWPWFQKWTCHSKIIQGITADAMTSFWIQDIKGMININQPYHLTHYSTHACHSLVTLPPFITSDKWWPWCQKLTCTTKIIVGCDQYRLLKNLTHCWYSHMTFFSPFDAIHHHWQYLCQIWTCKGKIIVSIKAMASFWMQDIENYKLSIQTT
jgi:hypothetical protein